MNQLPKTLPGFFWHFAKKQWALFLILQLFCLGWAFDHTLWPIIIQETIDKIVNFTGPKETIWVALKGPIILGICLCLGVEISYRLAGYCYAYLSPRLEATIRLNMFDYVQHHSYSYFSDNLAGNIANKISDMVDGISSIVKMTAQVFIPTFVAIIISVSLFIHLKPLFGIILLTWILVHMAICYSAARRCDSLAHAHSETRSQLTGKIVDSLTNNMNVKLFARKRHELEELSKYQTIEQLKQHTSLFFIEKFRLFLGIAAFLGPFLTLNWYMLYSWQHNQITAGDIVFIFNSSWNISMMVWMAGLQIPDLFREIGRCKQALVLVQKAHDITDRPNAGQLKVKQGEITFEHVTFHYNNNHHTLFQDKTITLEAGQKTGLVGFSGSGKSTFVHLILRFFDTEKGRILIDGQDITAVTQESLRSNIAMIPQDAALFHRTIYDNIRYGNPRATLDEVVEASKKAHCHPFIERLSDGYHTMVGERGAKLSGGQRQRIALARAILKNAPILILDEATSALDSVTEKCIQESLSYLMQNRTTIVIAHRLSTLADMDRIIVFHNGHIVEDGSHNELVSADGHYANMWAMQAEGFLPESG